MSIPTSDCNYLGTTFVSSHVYGLKLAALFSATSALSITVQTSNPAIFFNAASATLTQAASSGLFTANLQSACASLGLVNAVSTATVTGASASGLQVISPPTFTPTLMPTNNGTNLVNTVKYSLWTPGFIACVVIIGTGVLIMIIVKAMSYKIKQELTDNVVPFSPLQQQTVDEISPEQSILLEEDQITLLIDDIPEKST